MKLSDIFTAAAVFAAVCSQTSCSSSSGSDSFSDIELMPVLLQSEGKWSMVDHDGEVVYDGEFSEMPSAAVNGYFSVEEGDGFTLYKTGDKNPQPVDGMEKLVSVGYVSDGLIPATKKNSRITVMNTDGETVFELAPCKGAEIVYCSDAFSEGLLLFRTEDNKWGYCDKKGEVVIAPVYDYAFDFQEGLAVVGKDGDKPESDPSYSVIDKKGETLFKIKEGSQLISYSGFSNGYLLLKEDDRIVLCDKKGEIVKLPSKIEYLQDYNDKFIIYRNDNGCGVCDLSGEVIIRPKYEYMTFRTQDTFFAKKEGEDDEILVLDKNGEQTGKALDYKYIFPLSRFGYMAEEGDTWILLDDEGKPKTKDEYYNYNMGKTACYSGVATDYFDIAEIAGKMVGKIKGSKIDGIILGAPATSVFKGELASDYQYRSSTTIDSLVKNYYSYNIGVAVDFTEDVCSSEWNSGSSSYSYFWNPEAKVLSVDIVMRGSKEWGAPGQAALVKALKKAGFTPVAEDGELNALFKKDKVLVLAFSSSEGAMLLVADGNMDGLEDYIRTNMSAIAANLMKNS